VINGVEADTIHDRVTAVLALNTAFFALMEQFVGAGLLVGMAGIGVTMVRAVRERRREIGVLRSLGFPNRSVARAFVIEAIFVAVEGVIIGMSTAIIASYGLAHAGADWSEGLRWSLPTSALVIIAGATFAAALVASLWPALTASRIKPAVALRIAD
jgi:putative ABC transport system permease protein